MQLKLDSNLKRWTITSTFPEFLKLPTIDVNVINFHECDHQWDQSLL